MKIGGEYLLGDITLRQWSKFASSVRLDEAQVRRTCLELAERLPDALADVIRLARAEGLQHSVLQRLCDGLTARALRCRDMLIAAPPPQAD